MARVLISFIGTGRLRTGSSMREYDKTRYKIDNSEYDCTFISVALRKHLNIDRMILIGTTHSMWEDVYREYANPIDENIWSEIGEACESNNYKSTLEIPHLQDIEDALGGNSRVVLVKYGLTAKEIQDNSEIILSLDDSLSKGDELFVDITHSFRSLPLFIMNLLIYLRDVSPKKVKISGIYYGMLEVQKELCYAPIINLKDVLSINSWISGAYSFIEFGNAYKIANLIESDERIDRPNSVSNPLRGFTDAKNLNHLSELENQVKKLQFLRNLKDYPMVVRMVVEPVVEEFLKTVNISQGKFKNSDFQYKLAIWQKNNHNYAASYISLNEAILTRACELCGFNDSDYDTREMMKVVFRWARGIKGSDEQFKKLEISDTDKTKINKEVLFNYASLYKEVSKLRNSIAHNLRDDKGSVTNTVKDMINSLNNYLKRYLDL